MLTPSQNRACGFPAHGSSLLLTPTYEQVNRRYKFQFRCHFIIQIGVRINDVSSKLYTTTSVPSPRTRLSRAQSTTSGSDFLTDISTSSPSQFVCGYLIENPSGSPKFRRNPFDTMSSFLTPRRNYELTKSPINVLSSRAATLSTNLKRQFRGYYNVHAYALQPGISFQ